MGGGGGGGIFSLQEFLGSIACARMFFILQHYPPAIVICVRHNLLLN